MIAKLAAETGLELIEVELFQAGRREILRVFLDKPGRIGLEDCAAFSGLLGARLEADQVMPSAFSLEVSSPGLDRPLRTPADWRRRLGEWIQVRLREPVEGHSSWIGILIDTDGESATLRPEDSETTITLPFSIVALARVDVRLRS